MNYLEALLQIHRSLTFCLRQEAVFPPVLGTVLTVVDGVAGALFRSKNESVWTSDLHLGEWAEIPVGITCERTDALKERVISGQAFQEWAERQVLEDSFPNGSAVVSFPLSQEDSFFFLLGRKKNGKSLSSDEQAFLTLFSYRVTERLLFLDAEEKIRNLQVRYDQISTERELAERMASLGTIAAGLAHEIKNPLVSIRALAQLLPQRFDDPEFREHFAQIALDEVERINTLVNELLDFARPSSPRRVSIDVEGLLREALRRLSIRMIQGKIRLTQHWSGRLPPLWGDPLRLGQIFHNILVNGIEAMPLGGELSVTTRWRNGTIFVNISDTGTGIPEDLLLRVFEPFYTTKPSGTGLGLTLCKKIIEEHGGAIEVKSRPREGTMFNLSFPLEPEREP